MIRRSQTLSMKAVPRGLTGKDDTLIESDPKDKASLGVVGFQTEEQKGGSVSAAEAKDYCKQFGPSFDRICRGGILKTQKDTIDFCTNYATTCEGIQTDSHTDGEPKRASKADKMGFIQMKHADREKEDEQEESKEEEEPEPDLSLEDLNDDDLKSLETLHTSKQSTTTEKPKRNMEIDAYCEKYSENYNYYCAGEDPENPQQGFCKSYEKHCPDKVETEKQPPNPFSEDKGKPKPAEKSEPDPNFPDFDNPKFFPHCTADCKCDYLYPYVQKFCNPPPLPFFLNTCRLWYNGCPKYERYHYASQFIYSKAEKGKTVGQFPPKANFNIISPSGEQIPVHISEERILLLERYVVINGTVLPLPADVPKAKFGKDQVEGGGPGPIDKRQVPIVATDSVFSDPNLSQNFGAFTDPHGILHRPRSRSPFTKPGLWEPNPDNPHNRDHANKWYYHPRSVTADWLNGQVAWGAHWGVPAAGVGGTDGFSAIYFPTVGTFFNIPDDYD
ncbi:unnamed protein product, partial [Mesorhabditis spiculigera]